MAKKKESEEQSGAHFDRMAAFAAKFMPGGGAILGCVDVGREAYWWDYGRLGLYMDNNKFITDTSASAHALRVFLRLSGGAGGVVQASTLGETTVEEGSVC